MSVLAHSIRELDLMPAFSFPLYVSQLTYRAIGAPTYCGQPTEDRYVLPTLPAGVFPVKRERGAWEIRHRVGSERCSLP